MHRTAFNPSARGWTRRSRLAGTLVALAISVAAFSAPSAQAAASGDVNFVRNATSTFDSILVGASAAQKQWMGETYWRMRGYPPFFDQALGWAPQSHFYKDLYAIYPGYEDALMVQHPNWVLRDAQGERLYIQYDCSNGACTQYAADIGNPAWRAYWIADAAEQMAKGYAGIHVDDVNMEMRVSNGDGEFTRPIDPRTGQPMTDADWRRYVAEFTEEIRAAFPEAEIAHNPHWWVSHSDPSVQRQIDASDIVMLERGFNDRGIHGGGGTFGFETYLAHVDWLHARGKSVIYAPYDLDETSRIFELASYFLVQDGEDAIESDMESNPANWWSGWETDLGPASGNRFSWNGLLRRDFENGLVLVNQPGAATRTVTLPAGEWTDLEGNPLTSVTLGARRGAVLVGTSTEPAPAPDPITDPPPAPPVTDSADDAATSTGSSSSTEAAQASTGSPAVTIKSARRKVRSGRQIVLSGKAASVSGVVIEAQRGGSWRRVASGTVNGGAYKVALKARRAGLTKFRARVAGGGQSAVIGVRVR